MTRPDIRVTGGRELQRALRQVEGGTDDLKSTHAEGADVVAGRAREIVPRRTGATAGTIRSSGQARQGVVRAGGARHPGVPPTHFGWPARNISPQLYLYDALDERRGQVIGIYENAVGALIQRHGL